MSDSNDEELLAAAARVRELKVEYWRALAEDAAVVRSGKRSLAIAERARTHQRVLELNGQIVEAKNAAAKIRALARVSRCEKALQLVRAIVRDDAAWTPEVLTSTRERLLEETKRAFHDPDGASYQVPPELRPPELQAAPAPFPALSLTLSTRDALVEAGLLSEAPVSLVTPPLVPPVEVVASEPASRPRRVYAEPMPAEPPKVGECGKRLYTSKRAAREGNATAGFRVRPYECDVCVGWHVANGDKRRST